MKFIRILVFLLAATLTPLSGIQAAQPQDKNTDSICTALLFNALKEYNNENNK